MSPASSRRVVSTFMSSKESDPIYRGLARLRRLARLRLPEAETMIDDVERAMTERVRELEQASEAVAEANVRVLELWDREQELSEQLRRAQAELEVQKQLLEVRSQVLEEEGRAAAEAAVEAVFAMDEQETELQRRHIAMGVLERDQTGLRALATDLEQQARALAESNVESTMLAMQKDEELLKLSEETRKLEVSHVELQRQASVDGLTGLSNRRAFDAEIRAEVELARRHNYPVSVLFLDADYFKRVNDTFGHAVGDLVLTMLADTVAKVGGADLERRMTSEPLAARYGGEEFVLLLPDTSLTVATLVAEQIRMAVCSEAFAKRVAPVPGVTVSVGVAKLEPGEEVTDLVRRADKALYRAKETGRDRVVAAGPERATRPSLTLVR